MIQFEHFCEEKYQFFLLPFYHISVETQILLRKTFCQVYNLKPHVSRIRHEAHIVFTLLALKRFLLRPHVLLYSFLKFTYKNLSYIIDFSEYS